MDKARLNTDSGYDRSVLRYMLGRFPHVVEPISFYLVRRYSTVCELACRKPKVDGHGAN